ncbi:response regulator transcription factor [Aquimarina brevivitae]|uniref:LuxR family two component transcriptional regulator n=1 Tax=Aquimarina brevivitae TaxID=323412 RepID=A0A4Q7PHW9_9FLAO|nr:response regulator transcription factor [Aquimarina brevivitae]RZT00184.1 LuxR family two component transcriptional regulator [Aquimarina brevivitae]
MREFDVIVAYEDPLKRLGIKAMLEAPKDLKFNLYDEIRDLEQLRKVIVSLQPDFIVIDATLNADQSGIQLAEYTRRHSPRTKIVMMTFSLDEQLVQTLQDLEIKWVVFKAESVENIKKCAWRAIHNQPYISKVFRDDWYQDLVPVALKPNEYLRKTLSKTEIKVLNQVALGNTNKQIAEYLFKSEKTIKNHRHNICKKLNISGSNALFKYTMKLKDVFH